MPYAVVLFGPDDAASKFQLERCSALAKRIDGVEIGFVDSGQAVENIVAECLDVVVILTSGTHSKLLKPDLVRRMPKLKLIQTFSAGTDYLNKTALAELGVVVANNGGANAVAVAEHAIALMFSVYRKLDRQFTSVRAGTYMGGVTGAREEFHTLVGKRVGIVGLGRIGSRVAKRLTGWECEIVYYDPIEFDRSHEIACGANRVSLEELLSTSDVVTLHVPLDQSTRHLISDDELGLMKPSAILVNTCRGPVVDEVALIQALESKTIFAAGLDVTEIEPIDMNNPLLDLENVVLTPHMATRAIESSYLSIENVVSNAARVLRNELPEWIVAPV